MVAGFRHSNRVTSNQRKHKISHIDPQKQNAKPIFFFSQFQSRNNLQRKRKNKVTKLKLPPFSNKQIKKEIMKFIASTIALAASAAAFTPLKSQGSKVATANQAFTVDQIPGALEPTGIWDPLGFAERADEATLKRYREAELTHGRVGMLAFAGFLVGEHVEGSTPLFDATITGPAITHLSQTPPAFFAILAAAIGALEWERARIGWVEPENVKFDQPGKLRDSYIPGNLGFDPLGLKPEDPAEFEKMQNYELQNGRLGMLAAAGMIAQEMVDGKGIYEHWGLPQF